MSSTTSAAAKRSDHLIPLTSLRFLAALLVVVYHTEQELTTSALLPPLWADRFFHFVRLGTLSVSFFFFLSGYVLALMYLASGRVLDRRRFWLSRIARIYPLFLLTVLLDLPYLFIPRVHRFGLGLAIRKTTLSLGSTLLLLQGYIPTLRGLNAPCWSLSAQLLFYFCFPFLGIWLWKLKRLQVMATMLLLYVGGQIIVFYASRSLGYEFVRSTPILHLSTFLLGILLARLWCEPGRTALRLHHMQLPPLIGNAMFLLLAALLLAALLYCFPRLPFLSLHDGLLVPLYVALVYGALHPRLVLSRLLRAPWLVALGDASFGLYLIHFPVLHLYQRLHIPLSFFTITAYLLVSVCLSFASLRWFEEPTRQWVLRRFGVARQSREKLAIAAVA